MLRTRNILNYIVCVYCIHTTKYYVETGRNDARVLETVKTLWLSIYLPMLVGHLYYPVHCSSHSFKKSGYRCFSYWLPASVYVTEACCHVFQISPSTASLSSVL